MAKIQPVMQEFNTMAAPNATETDLANASEVAAKKISRPKKVTAGEKVISDVQNASTRLAAAEEKADAVAAVEAQNVKLTKENAQLTDKLAEYLEELNSLREQVKNPKIVERIVEKPVEVIKEVPSAGNNDKFAAEIAKLQTEVNKLQTENDEYLVKISELTFENAKLTSAMQELSKKSGSTAQAAPVQDGPEWQRNVYRDSDRLNGYSSWN
jgi:chromosome segregation ATPase